MPLLLYLLTVLLLIGMSSKYLHFPKSPLNDDSPRFRAENAITKLGAAQGLNQAMQCVGAILIAPLVRMYPTRTVLAAAVWGFALMTTILLIVDAATGGSIRQPGKAVDYGSWNPNAIFPVWGLAGVSSSLRHRTKSIADSF
jgi:hypothetical protein